MADGADDEDVLLVGSPTEDGGGLRVLRRREGELATGELRKVEEGRPLHGELVQLTARPEHPRLFDVTVHHVEPPPPRPGHAGPVRVSTRSYRAGWEALWGQRKPGTDPPN